MAFLVVLFVALASTAIVVFFGKADTQKPGQSSRPSFSESREIEEAARNAFRRNHIATRGMKFEGIKKVSPGWDVYFLDGYDGSYQRWKSHVIKRDGKFHGEQPTFAGFVYD